MFRSNPHSLKINPIVLVAGGSGGHLFPAISVAEACYVRKHPTLLLTDERGQRFVSGYESLFHSIHIFPKRSLFFELSRTPFSLIKILTRLGPKAMIGFGGQFTVLPMLVGRLLGIKCGIHQSDYIRGKANAFLAPWMHQVFLAHAPHTKKKERVIGMPIRQGFENIPPLDQITFPLKILILGGSQGAHIWSVLIPQAVKELSIDHQKQIEIVHQCPPKDQEAVRGLYQDTCVSFEVVPFIQDMPELLSKSHVVFSRAGASTLAELAVAGRPALLIPYPHAAQNHQQENAKAIASCGGGWVYDQDKITPSAVTEFMRSCLHNPDQLLYAGTKIKTSSHFNASSLLYEFCTTP